MNIGMLILDKLENDVYKKFISINNPSKYIYYFLDVIYYNGDIMYHHDRVNFMNQKISESPGKSPSSNLYYNNNINYIRG
jgi:hypothetical protein